MVSLPLTHWIWLPDYHEEVRNLPVLARFRKKVYFRKIPKRLILKISADTRYKLYVNGTFVQYGPARGDLKVWYADEMDIAPWLKTGDNVIAAEVLRYPLAPRLGNFGMMRTPTPGLLIEECPETNPKVISDSDMASSNKRELLVTDESWKCIQPQGYAIRTKLRGLDPLLILEECAPGEEDQGWKLPGYDDHFWQGAKAYNIFQIPKNSCPGDLSRRSIPFMKRIQRHFLSLVPKYEEGMQSDWNRMLSGEGTIVIPKNTVLEVEIDAGEEMTGFLSLRLRHGKGTVIKIYCAECYFSKETFLLAGSPVTKKGDRCDWKNGELQAEPDIYHVAGTGKEGMEEIYEPFWFRTFRFVRLEITTDSQPCEISGFDYEETGYPLKVKTQAEASDPDFDGIWDISLRTLKRCMQETYLDCPYYEQLQYAMDARSEILYTYSVSGDDRLARQCMEDLRRSQRDDGLLNACHPYYGSGVIPGFSIYYILMLYDHLMYFGDQKLIRKHLGTVDGILHYFDAHRNPEGMVENIGGSMSDRYWSFVDWSVAWKDVGGMPPSGVRGPVVMESFLYIYGLQHAAALCEYVNRFDTAEEYRTRAKNVQEALRTCCRDERGFFTDSPGIRAYSQHAQIFAVLTDTVPLEEGRMLLTEAIAEENTFAPVSVAFMFYMFRALEKAGMYEKTKRFWEPWRRMLKDHLTTCVENATDARSDCHAWGSLLLYELPAVILGVRPASPGYKTITVSPNPGFLDRAKGSVTTPWGNIFVEWEKQKDGRIQMNIDATEELLERIRSIGEKDDKQTGNIR